MGAGTGAVATNSTLPGPGQGPAPGTRQDGQNSFGDTSKFAASSDSTSSPVPSTVGNSVGQPTPFNLASSFTAAAAAQHPTLPPGYAYFLEVLEACQDFNMDKVEFILELIQEFPFQQLQDPPAPRSSRIKLMDQVTELDTTV